MTTELTAFIVSAGNNFAALWTSCPPWEYPLTTIFELGHELKALVTSEALFILAHLDRCEFSSDCYPSYNLHFLAPLWITAFEVVSDGRLIVDSLHRHRV